LTALPDWQNPDRGERQGFRSQEYAKVKSKLDYFPIICGVLSLLSYGFDRVLERAPALNEMEFFINHRHLVGNTAFYRGLLGLLLSVVLWMYFDREKSRPVIWGGLLCGFASLLELFGMP
jgi:hypothetical protein